MIFLLVLHGDCHLLFSVCEALCSSPISYYKTHELIKYFNHSHHFFPLSCLFTQSFIHFEPVGHSRDHGFNPDNDAHYESMLDIKAGFNHNGGLPPYIIDGSLEAFQWRRENPDKDWEPRWAYEADEEDGTGSNGAHYSSHTGNIELLQHIIDNPQHHTELIHEHDNNGWLPIHEGTCYTCIGKGWCGH